MIRQNESAWVVDGAARAWTVHAMLGGAVARRYLVEAAGDDYPPTVELDADEMDALTASIDPDLGPAERDAEISRRLDALVWPGGVPDGAE